MAMETPLSATRRITRSLAAAQKSAAAAAGCDSAALFSRGAKNAETQAQTRAALQDISNDSPIVGLAAGGLHATGTDKTPASTAAKTRRRAAAPRRTPGSGEALLRGQVKALLHKVEEEQGCVGGAGTAAAALVRPARIQALLGVARSPAQLLAPTPANTPQIGPVSAPRGEGHLLLDGAAVVVPCVLDEEELLIPKLQVIAASLPPPRPEEKLGDCQLNRALVFDDSPEKSEESNGSAVSLQESSGGSYMDKSSSPEDDNSSVWSTQVHASSEKGDEEELGVEEMAAEYTEEEEEEDWEEDSDDDYYDDLCEEMSRMTVLDEEEKKAAGLPQFEGKHTRFIYNSDDEIEREEVADAAEARAELGALMLRGLPVPQGRHLRFVDEDDEE